MPATSSSTSSRTPSRGRGSRTSPTAGFDFDALDRSGAPTRLRLGATAIDVRHEGDGVRVTYLRDGRAERVRARAVAIAASGQMARRIVADMPETVRANYARFHHGPVLVVNVALNNWRFLHRLGIGAGRWYDGFGFVGSIRAPMKVGRLTAPHHPDLPTVMTFYVPLPHAGPRHRRPGPPRPRPVARQVLPRLRARDPRPHERPVRRRRVRRAPGHRRHHPQPVGTRLHRAATGGSISAARMARGSPRP